ncbi:MAG: putative rRNA methylase family protein [Candidatus Daviesbacteria bacterium GW2011_GWA2_38_24]|uniref:Putative rRNA methylase family protein n=1 Tax=Candidatus Daviesbacteria bacterium GW2011_GWA2_38_24 TaxID=1618422 RepID=A0A0G0JVA2_9BACT|nr:MAG: putative rRNA methylase family protein [Candidatus Daviesbacteria bacterium GW2011_GWA2_38_24]KKQ79714.1 MAG: putative rRNA methylase family protein [Candidatus Daviesbacteria bacterium GW2011_GWA1_38_7]OGE22901.1 MAG: hypothetical protein A2688_04115 [Candidatus Daviesbacteria bacterium RIFCSPHIGHO2_01_FULL_38_8]
MDTQLLIILSLIILSLIGLSWFRGKDAPYVTTKSNKLNDALKGAGVKEGKVFYELGSGDGRVVFEAAKMGARAIGIEESLLRVWYSNYSALKQKMSNTKFIHGDIFKRTYADADIVFIYLLTSAVVRLEMKLKKELKKGSKVVTQTYHFKNWKPIKKIDNFWIYQK